MATTPVPNARASGPGGALGRVVRETAALALVLLSAPVGGSERDGKQADLRYEPHIRPIFEQHCVSCHGFWFPKASLRLDSRKSIMKGGRSGPAVVPGAPEKGWLVRSLDAEPGSKERMPPEGPGLSAREQRLILDWIAQGAR